MPEKDLLERIKELVIEKGKRWSDIAEDIEAEGFRDDEGNPYSANAIRKRWGRVKGERAGRAAEETKPTFDRKNRCQSSASDTSEANDSRIDLTKIKELLHEQTVSLKHELQDFVMEQMKGLVSDTSEVQMKGRPGYKKPAPVGERDDTGRGYTDEWRRVKLAATVHHKLETMFQTERHAREFSVSRMLDTVLWHYFGCPPLGDDDRTTDSD